MLIVEYSIQNCQVRHVQFLKIVFVYSQVVCKNNSLQHFPFLSAFFHLTVNMQMVQFKRNIRKLTLLRLWVTQGYEQHLNMKKVIAEIIWDKDKVYLIVKEKKKINGESEVIIQYLPIILYIIVISCFKQQSTGFRQDPLCCFL